MMRIAAFGAAFLDFIGAVFPVVALDEAAVAHLVFVDDLPLVIGIGVLQYSAIGSCVLADVTILGTPGTPQLPCFG